MSVQKINPEFTCQRWYLSDCQSWTNKCKTRHSERKVVSLDCYRLLSTSSEQISTPTGSASVAPGAHTAGEMVTSVGGSCDGSPPQGNGTLSNRWCDHEESLWPSCSSCPTSSSKSNIMWDSGCPQQDHSPPVLLSNLTKETSSDSTEASSSACVRVCGIQLRHFFGAYCSNSNRRINLFIFFYVFLCLCEALWVLLYR